MPSTGFANVENFSVAHIGHTCCGDKKIFKKRDYYDGETMERYRSLNNRPRTPEHREFIALRILKSLNLPKKSMLLDLGCGDGYFLSQVDEAMQQTLDLHGGDFSEYQREAARQRGNFTIAPMDIETGLKYENGLFDVAYAGEVIEHLYDPDAMLREINRILKINGTLIITTPNMNSWLSRILFCFGLPPIAYECSTTSSLYGLGRLKKFKKQSWPVGHVRLFNKNSMIDMLSDHGFCEFQVFGARFEFFPARLRIIDGIFSKISSLSSGMVIVCKKARYLGSHNSPEPGHR